MKKAVIFDLNGVFIQRPFLSSSFNQDFGIPEEKFLRALKDVMAKVRLPNAPPVYALWEPFLDEWGVEMSEAEFLAYWFRAEGENIAMLDLARELRNKGVQLFILSNNFRERASYYRERFPFLAEGLENLFTRVYYSWETGYIKPDARAFETLLRENALNPEECVYFDDSDRNVEVASRLGITSYMYEGPEKTRGVLEKEEML